MNLPVPSPAFSPNAATAPYRTSPADRILFNFPNICPPCRRRRNAKNRYNPRAFPINADAPVSPRRAQGLARSAANAAGALSPPRPLQFLAQNSRIIRSASKTRGLGIVAMSRCMKQILEPFTAGVDAHAGSDLNRRIISLSSAEDETSAKIISFYVKDCGMVEKKRAKRTKNVLQCPMC